MEVEGQYQEVGGAMWRCADGWVGVWDDGSGLRSEGGSEG